MTQNIQEENAKLKEQMEEVIQTAAVTISELADCDFEVALEDFRAILKEHGIV
jgi:hypothetical protein